MYKDKYEILQKSKEAKGKTFAEIDRFNRLNNKSNKGSLGQIIEESLFEYEVNSRKGPDFVEAGVELKLTPFKLNKNKTYSAKERLVLNIIDYNNEYKLEFENSSFWRKNKVLLLMFYLHDFDITKKDMKVYDSILYEYPSDDLEIIKSDYEIIKNKILAGKAHEISEADTMYLGACTKGSSSKSVRSQPFSKEPAKQRAFSLKQSYMTSVLRTYVINKKRHPKIIQNISQFKRLGFESYLRQYLEPYMGQEVEYLRKQFKITRKAKSFRAELISKILNVESITKTDEFIKSGMVFKTVFIDSNGKNKESMSFPYFKFKELASQSWEESDLKNTFESTKFVFAVFKINKDGKEYFDSIKFWKMPQHTIDNDLKDVWLQTKKILKEGNIVQKIVYGKNGKRKRYNNFPKSTSSKVAHVRPHGRNAQDTCALPVPDKLTGEKDFTKQCFWLNSSYILNIINNN
jgi:DNA mismatch repair protein MutH